MYAEVGDRVYMLKGQYAGQLGTVVFVDEGDEIPFGVKADNPRQNKSTVVWLTPDEITPPMVKAPKGGRK